jgi:hypothetical protein
MKHRKRDYEKNGRNPHIFTGAFDSNVQGRNGIKNMDVRAENKGVAKMRTEIEIRAKITEIELMFNSINTELDLNSKEGKMLALVHTIPEFTAGLIATTGELEILKWVLEVDKK